MKKIKVLVVEDSAVARELLLHVLASDPEIQVLGVARDGLEALEKIAQNKPDVITMDIHMPGMDGYEVTRRIMETEPVPIVLVSASYDVEDVSKTFRAMEAGAVAAVEKPRGPSAPEHSRHARRLLETIKAMAEVRVVKRWQRARKPAAAPPLAPVKVPELSTAIEIVGIGVSTGGPPVLQRILAALPQPFPVPIVIVQHISAGFVQGLADWLSQRTGISVKIASDGMRLLPGVAYLAPDGCQMAIAKGGRVTCRGDEPENGLRPSVACLFRSLAATYGRAAVGILLTGMGRDGAEELKLMRDRGALTFAQDKESSVVHGMPGAAIQLDAATHILPPESIALVLGDLVKQQRV